MTEQTAGDTVIIGATQVLGGEVGIDNGGPAMAKSGREEGVQTACGKAGLEFCAQVVDDKQFAGFVFGA